MENTSDFQRVLQLILVTMATEVLGACICLYIYIWTQTEETLKTQSEDADRRKGESRKQQADWEDYYSVIRVSWSRTDMDRSRFPASHTSICHFTMQRIHTHTLFSLRHTSQMHTKRQNWKTKWRGRMTNEDAQRSNKGMWPPHTACVHILKVPHGQQINAVAADARCFLLNLEAKQAMWVIILVVLGEVSIISNFAHKQNLFLLISVPSSFYRLHPPLLPNF